MDSVEKVGKNVRAMRISRKMTQKRLASLLGIHRTAVTELEMGRRRLSFDETLDLTRIFDCEIEDLAGGKDNA